MAEHPPLMATLAVKPRVVTFTLDVLVLECPKCHQQTGYPLRDVRPSAAPCCSSCGQPWKLG